MTDGVLAMERVHGVAYDAAAATYGPQLDGDKLLEFAIRGVLETTLIYGIFDLHAGNVLIERGDAFALVDFGICGRIDATQRPALVQFMLAFARMDAAGQLDALELSGALPPGVDRDTLAAELQPELDAINPADGHTLTFDEVGAAFSRILRILAAARFRLPKENSSCSSRTCSTSPGSPRASLLTPICSARSSRCSRISCASTAPSWRGAFAAA